jgi:uncharacterized protein RhaS with RHS repeats
MQARYYDPVIGRFYSNDPVDFMGYLSTQNGIHGFNRYSYGNNNPLRFIDPTGKSSEEASYWANALGFSSSQSATESINSSIEVGAQSVADAMPSKGTVHAVANGASLTLAVAAVTTPCTAVCAGASVAIDTAVAVDHLSNGDIKSAALTMLPGATGEGVSLAHKATKTAANVTEAGKRGAATNVLANQAVGDTQDYQNEQNDR